MSKFILFSKINGNNDYDNIKNCLIKFFKIDSTEQIPGLNEPEAMLFNNQILLINGADFYANNKPKGDKIFYFDNINENNYFDFIEDIKKLYQKLQEIEGHNIVNFEDSFKPNNTTICIHWGGSSKEYEEMYKVVESLSIKEKSVFPVAHFTSGDGPFYDNLTKCSEANVYLIQESLKFYEARAKNLIIKKKIYEIMEKILITGFEHYLNGGTEGYEIDGNIFEIEKDKKILEIEKEITKPEIKGKIEKFFAFLNPKDNGKYLIENLRKFRSSTYSILEEIEGPIYPRSL